MGKIRSSVPSIRGPKYDLINSFFFNDLPWYGLRPFEDFPNNCGIAGISKSWQCSIDAEIVERREHRVTVSLGCLLIVFGQGQ